MANGLRQNASAPVPGDRRHPTSLGRVGAVLFGVAGFIAGATAIDRLFPRTLSVLTPKLQYFAARKDDYTVVFLGPSTTYRHVVPDVFGREVRALGQDERAFNFGVPALTLAEALVVTDDILRLRPRRLRRVIVDLTLLPSLGPGDYAVSRNAWSHTTGETARYVGSYVLGPAPLATTLQRVRDDLNAWARNMTSIGRLAERFRARWDPTFGQDEQDNQTIDHDGYWSLEDEPGPTVTMRREAFARARARFERNVVAFREHPGGCRHVSAYQATMLARIVHRLRDAGVSPLFYESPALGPSICFEEATLSAVPVLSLKDPIEHAALYDVANHFDDDHLTATGATVLSTDLARLYARAVGVEPAPQEPGVMTAKAHGPRAADATRRAATAAVAGTP